MTDLFWALQKHREDIRKAWREGFEERRRRALQAATDELEQEAPGENSEPRMVGTGEAEVWASTPASQPGSSRVGHEPLDPFPAMTAGGVAATTTESGQLLFHRVGEDIPPSLAAQSREVDSMGFGPVPGAVPASMQDWAYHPGKWPSPLMPIFLPYSVDWNVNTPSGIKSVAWKPDGKGGFITILVDADPVVAPQE